MSAARIPAAARRRQAGFSLIEIMIVVVIMATISLIAWRGLDSISRANTAIQLRTEETARLMRTLQQIERDLAWRTTVELPSVATEKAAQDEEENTEPDAGAQGHPKAPMALLPPGMNIRRTGQSGLMIELIRAAPAAPGRWQRVQWWLQGDTLYRSAGEAAAEYPMPAPHPADRVAVLDGIASFEVRAWEPGRGWIGLPAKNQAREPATGLEVKLGVRRSAGPVLQYRRVFALD